MVIWEGNHMAGLRVVFTICVLFTQLAAHPISQHKFGGKNRSA